MSDREGDPRMQFILSTSEEDRVAKLGEYFRMFLSNWLADVTAGTRFTPGVARELCTAMVEVAALALIASSDAAKDEDDDATADRCHRAAEAAMVIIQREVLS